MEDDYDLIVQTGAQHYFFCHAKKVWASSLFLEGTTQNISPSSWGPSCQSCVSKLSRLSNSTENCAFFSMFAVKNLVSNSLVMPSILINASCHGCHPDVLIQTTYLSPYWLCRLNNQCQADQAFSGRCFSQYITFMHDFLDVLLLPLMKKTWPIPSLSDYDDLSFQINLTWSWANKFMVINCFCLRWAQLADGWGIWLVSLQREHFGTFNASNFICPWSRMIGFRLIP